jgi:hypothetical protein
MKLFQSNPLRLLSNPIGRGRYEVWVYYAEDDSWVLDSTSDNFARAKQTAKELSRPENGVRAVVEDSETGRVYTR